MRYFALLLVLLQIPLIMEYLSLMVYKLGKYCPNNDYLGWDSDLRLVTTLKIMNSFREFDLAGLLKLVFDSPTWPVFRNLIESAVFIFTGVQPVYETMFTVATLVILLAAAAWILLYTDKQIIAVLFFLVFWTTVFQSQPLMLYTFSGMLEIQGGLFFLLSAFLFSIFLGRPDIAREKKFLWLFFFSVQALYHTKYPYGYMFLLAAVLLYSALNHKPALSALSGYKNEIKKRRFKNYSLAVILILTVLWLLLPAEIKTAKAQKSFKFLLYIIFTLHILTYYFKNRKAVIVIDSGRLDKLVLTMILPVMVWTGIHPDRFSSSSGTIAHIQSQGNLPGIEAARNMDYYLFYLKELQEIVFSSDYAALLTGILFISFISGLMLYRKNKHITAGLVISSIVILQIAFLTFLTPNHQARHIYHLYPAILLLPFFIFLDLKEYIPSNRSYIKIGILLFFLMLLVYFSVFRFFSGKSEYYARTHICFSGVKPEFELPEWIKLHQADILSGNAVVYNFIDPVHVNKADTEMILSLAAWQKKSKVLFDPGRHITIKPEIKRLVLIGHDCSIKEKTSSLHKDILRRNPVLNKTMTGKGCILLYELDSIEKSE